MRFRLRTLLIALALGPPILAWAWLNRVPLGITLTLLLTACVVGTVLGRSLLWGMEGVLTAGSWITAAVWQSTRRKKLPDADDSVEFSLSRFASKVKARRKA